MAVYAFTNAKFTLNSVNLSDHVHKVTIHTSADDLETTAMGATYKSRIGGLLDYSVNVEFNQDFAGASVDATIFPLLGTVVAFTVKRDAGANSATNPEYQGSVLISDYSPLDGAVGDLGRTSMTFPGSGTLTRATS